ncbi:MAG: glycosyltransferase family 39 protein [bacterium]
MLSAVPLLLHLYTNAFAGYGYFRDELYYLACTDHLGFGYVDHPPLSIFILALNKLLFGDSLFAVRLLPAVNSALTVFITCLMVKKFNGSTAAIIIASLAVIFAPVYLAMNSYYSMNSFDILLWALAVFFIIKIIDEDKLYYWIFLGIIMGFGLMNKIGFLWLGFGFFAGLLISDKRKLYLTSRPYLTALIAFLMFSPFIIWNLQNNFAHLEFIRNATSKKYSGLNISDFIKGQFMNMNPASAVIWLCGLYYFLFNRNGKKYRILGIIYLTSFLILIINGHSKAEYLSPAYTFLFAGGAVVIADFTKFKFVWLRYVVIFLVIVLGIIAIPVTLPILPVEKYISYSNALGFKPSSSESKKLSDLPQFYADMHGWEEMAKNVSNVYLTLSEEDKKRALVYGQNYGEASAINFYRNKYPLPEAVSNHNSYWLWMDKEINDPVFIIIGGEKEDNTDFFEYVEQAGMHSAQYPMPYENDLKIFVARKMKGNMKKIWDRIKNYD